MEDRILPVTYIFTHDSISVGPDGATHQPVEQLASLRVTPNLEVFRPADANEVIGVYRAIFEKESGPSVITLSRNTLPILETTKISEVVPLRTKVPSIAYQKAADSSCPFLEKSCLFERIFL